MSSEEDKNVKEYSAMWLFPRTTTQRSVGSFRKERMGKYSCCKDFALREIQFYELGCNESVNKKSIGRNGCANHTVMEVMDLCMHEVMKATEEADVSMKEVRGVMAVTMNQATEVMNASMHKITEVTDVADVSIDKVMEVMCV